MYHVKITGAKINMYMISINLVYKYGFGAKR